MGTPRPAKAGHSPGGLTPGPVDAGPPPKRGANTLIKKKNHLNIRSALAGRGLPFKGQALTFTVRAGGYILQRVPHLAEPGSINMKLFLINFNALFG